MIFYCMYNVFDVKIKYNCINILYVIIYNIK